jgi:hypothetical protein
MVAWRALHMTQRPRSTLDSNARAEPRNIVDHHEITKGRSLAPTWRSPPSTAIANRRRRRFSSSRLRLSVCCRIDHLPARTMHSDCDRTVIEAGAHPHPSDLYEGRMRDQERIRALTRTREGVVDSAQLVHVPAARIGLALSDLRCVWT